MTLEAAQQLLHYRLIEQIGEGGMGVVWKASMIVNRYPVESDVWLLTLVENP